MICQNGVLQTRPVLELLIKALGNILYNCQNEFLGQSLEMSMQYCDEEVVGTEMYHNCGGPKEKGESLLKKSGDWVCSHCSCNNFAAKKQCYRCKKNSQA